MEKEQKLKNMKKDERVKKVKVQENILIKSMKKKYF